MSDYYQSHADQSKINILQKNIEAVGNNDEKKMIRYHDKIIKEKEKAHDELRTSVEIEGDTREELRKLLVSECKKRGTKVIDESVKIVIIKILTLNNNNSPNMSLIKQLDRNKDSKYSLVAYWIDNRYLYPEHELCKVLSNVFDNVDIMIASGELNFSGEIKSKASEKINRIDAKDNKESLNKYTVASSLDTDTTINIDKIKTKKRSACVKFTLVVIGLVLTLCYELISITNVSKLIVIISASVALIVSIFELYINCKNEDLKPNDKCYCIAAWCGNYTITRNEYANDTNYMNLKKKMICCPSCLI